MKITKATWSYLKRIVIGAAFLITLAGLPFSTRATPLIVESFNTNVLDNTAIGTATGWSVWSITNGIFADLTTNNVLMANGPSISRAAGGGFGGVTGNTVLAVTNSANPTLMWTNSTVALHDCIVTNVIFYTKNNSSASRSRVAVLMGGQWYVTTQTFQDGGGNSTWALNTFTFTNGASFWRTLNTNDLSLGATNVAPLPSGDIQGIGIYGFAFGTSLQKIRVDEFIVNGLLPSAPVIPTPTASPSASVTAPTTVTLSVAATGTPPFTYQWRKSAGNLTDGPSGSGSTYTGSLSNQLVISTTSTADSGNYDVIVMNNYGTNTSPVLAVTVSAAGVPPTITEIVTTPASGTNEVGGSPMSIQVEVAGTGPFDYQWRKSGADLLNETNATLTLASVFTNSSSYDVIVTSAYGSITSSPPTTLTVVDTTPPVITFPAGNPTNIVIKSPFTPVYSVTDNSGETPNVVVTGSVDTNVCGTYTLQITANDASNNTNSASLVVNVLLINERFNEAVADNAPVSTAPGWHASARAVATSQVNDYTGTGGNANFPTLSMNVTAPGAVNGAPGFLVMGEALNANPSLIWKDTTTLLHDQQITNLTFYSRNNSASSTAQIAIRIGTNWYASTTVFTDTSAGNVPWVPHVFTFTNDPAAWQELDPATLMLGSVLAEPLPNYSISAVGFYGYMAAGKIRLDEVQASGVAASFPATPPSVGAIALSPTNRVDGSAWTGTPLTFQVSAIGTLPLTYIWHKDGAVLPATSNVWTLPSPVVGDSGNYDVIVTNISGIAVTSAVVALTVSPNQIFVNQHFQSTNDPGVIGQIPGWHALAYSFTNSAVTDYTLTPNPPINPNYPNLSTGPGSDGTSGYLVMGQGDTVNPILVWMDTPLAVQQGHITNILFSSRNTFASSTVQVAVQIAGQWYISTTLLTDTTTGVVPWAAQSFQFTLAAGAWQTLDISTLAPGSVTSDPLTNAPITGIGLYGEMYGVTTARIRIDEFLVDGLASTVVPPPQPSIQPVYHDGFGNLVVRTTTSSGWNYVLESTLALQSPITWTPVLTNAGTGGIITNLVPVNPATPKQFFRYHVQ